MHLALVAVGKNTKNAVGPANRGEVKKCLNMWIAGNKP